MYKTLVSNLKLNEQTKEILDFYCLNSRALYNSGLFILNNTFKETKKYIPYPELYHIIKSSVHYKNLPTAPAQQTLRMLDRDFRSFFSLLKAKNRNEYREKLRTPNYKPKGSKFQCIFNSINFQIKEKDNHNLYLTAIKSVKEKYKIKSIKIPFKIEYLKDKEVIELRIQPTFNNEYKLLLIYKDKIAKEQIQVTQDNYLSIDLGINNLMTCFETQNKKAFIYSGKEIKSINQFYNKRKASLKSKAEKINKKKFTKRLRRLEIKRANKIKDKFHKISKNLIQYCKENKINNIIIGHNKDWKRNINLGSKINQKFVQIPYSQLTDYIKYKAEEIGIKIHFQEESYTSKASFLSNDNLPTYNEENKTSFNFSGKRIKRGLYKDLILNKVINSDLNGSLNILRKFLLSLKNVSNEFLEKEIISRGLAINPIKLKSKLI